MLAGLYQRHASHVSVGADAVHLDHHPPAVGLRWRVDQNVERGVRQNVVRLPLVAQRDAGIQKAVPGGIVAHHRDWHRDASAGGEVCASLEVPQIVVARGHRKPGLLEKDPVAGLCHMHVGGRDSAQGGGGHAGHGWRVHLKLPFAAQDVRPVRRARTPGCGQRGGRLVLCGKPGVPLRFERGAVVAHQHRVELPLLPGRHDGRLVADLHHRQHRVVGQIQRVDQSLRVLLLQLHHARIEHLQRLALIGPRAWQRGHLIHGRSKRIPHVQVEIDIDPLVRERR